MMHENVLPPGSRRALEALQSSGHPAFRGWILAGGTGLALQIGHRVSEDFDLFRTDAFSVPAVHAALGSLSGYETLLEDDATLVVRFMDTKLSFFRVADPFLYAAVPWPFTPIAAPMDIALMKIAAISSRGARKDFIDLYLLLAQGRADLPICLADMTRKYGANRVNRLHLLKSMIFFDDAEKDPLPRMLVPFDWAECRRHFEAAVRSLIKTSA